MSVDPGYSQLPFREQTIIDNGPRFSVHRKTSKSKSLAISMVKREIWEDACSKMCSNYDKPMKDLKFHPEYNGIIEGIVQVNPWLMPRDLFVYVEVICKYSYDSSEIDRHEIVSDNIAFKDKIELLPAACERENFLCLSDDPEDIQTYSEPLLEVYKRYGGRIGSQYEKSEYIDRNGANEPFKNERFQMTCLKRTDARLPTTTPHDPYIVINLPFKFNLNGKIDSVDLYSDPKKDRKGRRDPPNLTQLENDARFGFQVEEIPSDAVTTESEEESTRCHIFPNETRKKSKRYSNKTAWTEQKDLGHKDSYMWIGRQKRRPQNGVRWSIRVYAVPTKSSEPLPLHDVNMSFRKFSYSSNLDFFKNKPKQSKFVDFCVAKVPEIGIDCGAISVVGSLNQRIFNLGDSISVYLKIHNRSARLIERVVVELVQKIRMRVVSNRNRRCVICRRVLSSEQDNKLLPIVPGTENVLILAKLHPWATLKQAQDLYCSLDSMEKPMRKHELEAWRLRKSPRIDKLSVYAEMPNQRHVDVPFQNIMRKYPSMSTINEDALNFLHDRLPTPPKALSPSVWKGNPMAKDLNMRNTWYPKVQPYAKETRAVGTDKDLLNMDRDWARNFERYFEMDNECRVQETLSVQYEVVVSVELIDPDRPDRLAFENQLYENTGHCENNINRASHLRAVIGPQLVLPLVYLHGKPLSKNVPPVGNFRVEQRQFHEVPGQHVSRQVWEPNPGYGNYVKGKPPMRCQPIALEK